MSRDCPRCGKPLLGAPITDAEAACDHDYPSSRPRAARPTRRKRTPWDRIIRAGQNAAGVSLSPEDCAQLAYDGAIETRGLLDAACYDAGHDPAKCYREECEA